MTSQKQWLGIFALFPTVALIFMDQTIVSVALPTIQRELETTAVAGQWCVNAYFLALTVLLLASGKLSDRIGHRRSLTIGMCIFALSSFFCGISPNVALLIAGRALQGIGASMMMPAQSTIIAHLFPIEKRGKATGIIVSTGAIFLVIAPLIGGFLTQTLSWRWIFWVNLPIAAFGLVMIQLLLPRIEPGHKKIDLKGFIYFGIAVSFITLLFMQANEWGWLSFKILGCLICALTGALLLARREKKSPHPFLDLSLFKKPKYAAITLSISITQFVFMISVFQAIYFQGVIGLSPLQVGSLQFVSCSPVLFVPLVAGYLSDRFSPKLPVSIGFLLLIFSFFFFGFNSTPPVWGILFALLCSSTGGPMIFTPSFSTAMSSVPPTKIGVGFGMLLTLRMFAATLGLALTQLFVAVVQTHYAGDGKRLAEIISFSRVNFALGFLLIVALAITFILHSRKSAHQIPELPSEGWD